MCKLIHVHVTRVTLFILARVICLLSKAIDIIKSKKEYFSFFTFLWYYIDSFWVAFLY